MLFKKSTKRARTNRNRRMFVEQLEARRVFAWTAAGPFTMTNGQVEGITNRPVVGSIHTIVAHPTNPDIMFAGSVNGGIWRTTNATAASPSWTPQTDTQSSQSIGAITYDRADATFQTLWAGNAGYSSYGGLNAGRDGLLRSTDGGTTWTRVTGGGLLAGKSISGIVANGQTITVSVNIADSFTFGNIGIFRSNNGGTTFTKISGLAGSGMPEGVSYDLVADPDNPDVMYTSSVFESVAGTMGVYKSVNGGANWTRVSNTTMNLLFSNNTSNVEFATAPNGIVYAAILNSGNLVGLFRSANAGSSWTAMDIPVTNEVGGNVGLNPRGFSGPLSGTPEEIAGGQGAIHFSIVADPTDPNIVYVGGDRQPRGFQDAGSFPNAIGANDFSGRLFRGDASRAAGSQFVHLTHRNNLGAAGGGTASNSAPHADSREMVFRADGVLVESDDGGVYRRTSPRNNTGDWFSMNGNLQTTEAHDVAYDTISNVLITGNQDTGTTYQPTSGATVWDSLSTGDGGDVAVDDIALAGSNQSIRYSSFQNLGSLRRSIYNSSGNSVSFSFPTISVVSGSALSVNFRTPIATNQVVGNRLLIQGSNSLYEATNVTSTSIALTEIGVGRGTTSLDQDALVYGGRLNGVNNPNVVWAASASSVLFRSGTGAVALTAAQPTTSTIRDLIVDPENFNTAFIVTSTAVFQTTNAGSNWQNITGNLSTLTSNFFSLQFVRGKIPALAVGTEAGVFVSSTLNIGTWVKLDTGLPNVLIPELDYDAADDVLVAGTFGRGVWTLNNATAAINVVFPPFDFGDAPDSYSTLLASNGPRHIGVGPTLGASRDLETDGLPSLNATGDDGNNVSDENGVTFLTPIRSGAPMTVRVNAPAGGVLDAWLDMNRNGVFDGASEALFTEQTLSAGDNDLAVTIVAPILAGPSFARFRIASNASFVTSPFGEAADGEVEDYAVTLSSAGLGGSPSYNGSFYLSLGSDVDTSLSLAESGSAATTLTASNVSSNLQGINAITLSVSGLASNATLTASDFAFRMSPQGPYNEAANQPSTWTSAPAPSGISVIPNGASSIVRIVWPNNSIENRWLQIQLLPNATNGFAARQTYYLGHLKGDIDMQSISGVLTVLNEDITAALPLGGVGSISSRRDIDKNGFILVNDFTQIRDSINRNLALRLITIPVAGSANEAPAAPGLLNSLDNGFMSATSDNEPPTITVNAASVTGGEGTSITNSGTWGDINIGDVVTLSATAGTIVKNANGTWSWSITPPDNIAATTVTVTASDGVATSTLTFTYAATNVAPTVTRTLASVSGNVLSTIINTGTYADVAGDNVTLTASTGTIVRNVANSTWSWSITPTAIINNQTVTITATDKDGGSSSTTFALSALANVSAASVYYKSSAYAALSVAEAIDPVTVVAKAGANPVTLSGANIINYTRGINGMVLDVAGLAASSLTASDFTIRMSPTGAFDTSANVPATWASAPAPTLIAVTPGNSTTPARIRLEFPDSSIMNRWLQVRVLATPNTGLLAPQTFYLGHLLAEIDGVIDGNGVYNLTDNDITVALPLGQVASVGSSRDIDKNRFVLVNDFTQIRASINAGTKLSNITIPVAGSTSEDNTVNAALLPAEGEAAPLISSTKLRNQLVDSFFGDL